MHRNLCLLAGPPEMEIGVITRGDASCKCEDICCFLNEEIFLSVLEADWKSAFTKGKAMALQTI